MPRSRFEDVLQQALAPRYRIEREIGQGAMATIYLAEEVKYPRWIAIKVMKADLGGGTGAERFSREIRVTAAFTHPNILPVLDSGQVDGIPYYVTPYIEGESLQKRLERTGPLPLEEAVVLVREVAGALEAAHARGIVHRDIKPANILLESGHAIVADFGILHTVLQSTVTDLTATGVSLGTPTYMSPEQAEGQEQLDGRSDVYSLACLAYEMLAGVPPFRAPNLLALQARKQLEPPALASRRPGLPPALDAVFRKALAPAPADRYQSARELAEAMASAAAPGARRTVRRLALAPALLLALAAVAFWLVAKDRGTRLKAAASAPSLPNVAVLYFDDLTPGDSLAHIAAGLTETLIAELSGSGTFFLVPQSGVRQFRAAAVPRDSIVNALSVDYLITGRVSRVLDRIRVSVDLLDVESHSLSPVSVDRPAGELVELERELSMLVRRTLGHRLGAVIEAHRVAEGTRSSRALEYLFWARRNRADAQALAGTPDPDDLRSALHLLQRADSLLVLAQATDPGWLRPLLDRSWTALDQARLLAAAPRREQIDLGLRYAEEALHGQADNAEALALRGALNWLIAADLEDPRADSALRAAAENDLRAALDRDSTIAEAWATLSFVLQSEGAFAEAVQAAQRALRADPYFRDRAAVLLELTYSNMMLGDFAAAASWCAQGRLAFPADWRFVQAELSLMRHDTGARPDTTRAWALVAELNRLDPPAKALQEGRRYFTIYRPLVAATISARAGRPDIARAELARAIRATAGDPSLRLDLLYDEAYLLHVLGQDRLARERLDTLLAHRPLIRGLIARDPLLRTLGYAPEG